MTQPKLYSVLTGDIVKSSRLSPRQLESVRSSLTGAVGVVGRWQQGLVKDKPDFFRGDAWQLLLRDTARALRVGVYLRAAVLAKGLADTRVSIGLGRVDKVSSGRISLSMGEAFTLSGRGLDNMTQYSRMTVAIPEVAGPLSGWMTVVGHLCDSLMGQWTQRQAEVVCVALDPTEPGQDEIAKALKPAISKQAVAKALNGANWYAIREAVRLFETTLWESLLRSENKVTTKKGCLPPDNQKRLSPARQPKKVV
jgi:hypothetical protein